jgi:hypothetical protein
MGTITCTCSCGWSGQMPEESDAWTCPGCSIQYPADWRGLYFLAVCPRTEEPVGLSDENARNPRFKCLRCGRRHQTNLQTTSTKASLPDARYVGGNSALGPPQRGRLIFTPKMLGIGDRDATSAAIPLASVENIAVTGGEVAQSKIGSVLALGVIGLAAKGAKNQSAIVVRTNDGQAAYYMVDYASPINVRAKIAPILKAAGVPLISQEAAAQPAPPSAPISVADELAKLASLRNDGVLTDEEFEAQKAKLLAAEG